MCVIVTTIVFKCSSIQCHDFLLIFLSWSIYRGGGGGGGGVCLLVWLLCEAPPLSGANGEASDDDQESTGTDRAMSTSWRDILTASSYRRQRKCHLQTTPGGPHC